MANGPDYGQADDTAGGVPGSDTAQGDGQGQGDVDANDLIDLTNRMLVAFGQQKLPNDTDESNVLDRLETAVAYVEKFKQSSSNAAMRNRLRVGNRHQTSQRPSDDEVAARLQAKGIDPKHMPRLDGSTYRLSNEAQLPGQASPIVTLIQQLLKLLGQSPMPPDTNEQTLPQRLQMLIDHVKANPQATVAPAATMANRQRKPSSGIPTDSEVAARLQARGIDPKYMPKSGR